MTRSAKCPCVGTSNGPLTYSDRTRHSCQVAAPTLNRMIATSAIVLQRRTESLVRDSQTSTTITISAVASSTYESRRQVNWALQ